MKQSLRIIPFLLGLFLFIEGFLSPASARTENTNKEVLVLNSINSNLPWAKNFYWCLHDALQKQGISVKAESLSVPALVNEMAANAVVTHLRQKYPEPPTAIVMIGDPGWIVCRELFDDVWKDVPVVVTNARIVRLLLWISCCLMLHSQKVTVFLRKNGDGNIISLP